jgi:hypothetical protein
VTSIAALVYASVPHARHLWDNLRATCPELGTGEAEFRFIANDATDEVLAFLVAERIPHVVQINPRLSNPELQKLGIGKPEYIRRDYQGWNRAIMEARNDCLVLLSSDHVMSPGWLGVLRSKWHPGIALSALTIEPGGAHGVFPARLGGGTGAFRGSHGSTLATFDARGFAAHAATLVSDRLTPGGAHQPVMVSRRTIIDAGLYPEGNLHAGTFDRIKEYGDRRLFRLLAERGVLHHTYHGTVAYHFGEGEMREAA